MNRNDFWVVLGFISILYDLFSWMYICIYAVSVFLNFLIVLHGTFISETFFIFLL